MVACEDTLSGYTVSRVPQHADLSLTSARRRLLPGDLQHDVWLDAAFDHGGPAGDDHRR